VAKVNKKHSSKTPHHTQPRHKKPTSWKPGSGPSAGKEAKGDFGVPAGTEPSLDRDYTSQNTKASDPGTTQPMGWEHDGKRDHGVGVPDSGPGSGSAGDLDPDIIGVGTGGTGVSVSGPDDDDGPVANDIDPNARPSDAMAAGGHARGENQSGVGKLGGAKPIRGSTVQTGDLTMDQSPQGSDAATNPIAYDGGNDDSFQGEVSRGESRGEDQPIEPNDPRGDA